MYTFTYTVLSSTLFANALPLFSGEVVGTIWVVAFFCGQTLFDSIGPCAVTVPFLGSRLYTIRSTLRLTGLSIRYLLCSTSLWILNHFDKPFSTCWCPFTWHCSLLQTWLLFLVLLYLPYQLSALVVTIVCPCRSPL